MLMGEITGKLLNQAVEIYLEHAYRRAEIRRPKGPAFDDNASLKEIVGGAHPFEDLTGATVSLPSGEPVPVANSTTPRVYALPLGNESYPHMKLALVEVYYADEFVFVVDRHDTFHCEPNAPGYEAWCQLKEINRVVKEAIETAWSKAGIPTLHGLRKERFTRPDLVREMRAEGQGILVLDDDESRAEITKGILTTAGYAVIVGPPGPPPDLEDAAVQDAMKKAQGESLRLPASRVRNAGDVTELEKLIGDNLVALIILDVSYRTGQGPQVAASLRMSSKSQEIPILGVYSRRDFGPDPDLFDVSLRRPYHADALLSLVDQVLVRRAPGSSGLHKAV